jgi:hypothetical protein
MWMKRERGNSKRGNSRASNSDELQSQSNPRLGPLTDNVWFYRSRGGVDR